MSDRFTRLLYAKPYLLADGATGTNLFAAGLQSGDVPEFWNIDHPERIAELHRGFIDAGSDIILTNSFGGTRYRLKLHTAENRVAEINLAAARIARREVDATPREVIVAGSMGPTGELFAPLGPLTLEDATKAFAEQAQALAEGGVDLLWIETLSSREEAEAALAGAASTGLPAVCTMSFDTSGHTMMGLTPADWVNHCQNARHPPSACGSNCGIGAAEVVAGILAMAATGDVILVAKANCGIPEYVDGAIRYNGTPELMADYARLVRDAGARIIGGCCGTTPAHVRAMKEALDGYKPGAKPDLDTIALRLGAITPGARSQAGEGKAAPASARRGQRLRRAARG